MINLLGALCFYSSVACTHELMLIGKPYATKQACEEFKDKLDEAIKPIPWMDGAFICVDDEVI